MSIRLRDDHIILLVLTVIIRKAYQSKEFFVKYLHPKNECTIGAIFHYCPLDLRRFVPVLLYSNIC